MQTSITNEEIIRLTAFIDAGEQLSQSEFFGEDNYCKISSDGSAQFGPSSVLRAALAPFRRMWMEQENANFNCVAKIIESTSQDHNRGGMAFQQREFYNKHRLLMDDKINRTQKEIVDLWLNTQFAHCQTSTKKGYVTRFDFDVVVKQVGQNYFEYAFRNAVRLLGTHMLILYCEAARPEFDHLVNSGAIQPPFVPSNAFGSDYSELLASGGKTLRSPHMLLEREFPAQKLVRLLERNQFSNLKFVLGHLLDLNDCTNPERSYTKAYECIVGSCDINTLCKAMDYGEKSFDINSSHSRCNFTDTVTFQRGTVHLCSQRRLIRFEDSAKELLELQYQEVRNELLADTRKSTFLDLQRRLQRDLKRQRDHVAQKRQSSTS